MCTVLVLLDISFSEGFYCIKMFHIMECKIMVGCVHIIFFSHSRRDRKNNPCDDFMNFEKYHLKLHDICSVKDPDQNNVPTLVKAIRKKWSSN